MKILLAGSLRGKGGIQSHLRWLSKALVEEGIEVLVLSLGYHRDSIADVQDLHKPTSSNIQVIFCNPSRWRRILETTAIIKNFSPDVYLAVGTGWNLFVPPLLSGVKTKRIFHEVMSGVPNGWHDSRWIVRWCFDEVIGQSPTVAKTFAKFFGWKKAVLAIPAMPEPLELSASLPLVVSKKVELGKAKAGFFSRLAPHKQAFWLVQQWDLLKDILGELHIHGSGPEEPLIREYIASQKIGDRVKCFGRYPEGQAYVDLLSSFDLTLLPTIGAEGAPLVLLESMACGVPFIAYGVGGIPDYGVNNPNVLVVPTKPDVFISGVKQMVYLLSQGQINQEKLQNFYLERYSYSILKKTWLSYFFSQ
ncbi:MAG: glycosyltransferase family 4 protein [Nostoc sp.]|uniref:glycosyltransferase family 4 protein n=1 Tax=Nostoc sp. TaxID=1180 RepID=UPI002FF8450E